MSATRSGDSKLRAQRIHWGALTVEDRKRLVLARALPGVTSRCSVVLIGLVALASCVRSSDEGRGTVIVVEYPEGRVAVGERTLAGDSDVVLVYPPGAVLATVSTGGCADPPSASASLPRAERVVRGRNVPRRLDGFEHALAVRSRLRCAPTRLDVDVVEVDAVGASTYGAGYVTKQSLDVLTSSATYRLQTLDRKSLEPLVLSASGKQYFANSHDFDQSYLQWRGNVDAPISFTIAAQPRAGGAAVVDGATWGTAILDVDARRRRKGLRPDPRYHIARLWERAPLGYTSEYPVIPCVPDRAGEPFLMASATSVFSVWAYGDQISAGLCLDESGTNRPVTEGTALPALGQFEATRVLHAAAVDGRLEVAINVNSSAARSWLPGICPNYASFVAVGDASLANLGETPGPGRDGWAGILSFPETVTWATGVGGLGPVPRRQVFVSGGKVFLFSEEEGLCGLEGLEDTVVEQVAGRGDGFMLALGKRGQESVLWKISDVQFEQ